jgi:hypothetical protein
MAVELAWPDPATRPSVVDAQAGRSHAGLVLDAFEELDLLR